jgi:putative AlgH/UPF0301 family transcriptional regulator
MEDNIHPIILLLAARKENHPEEFGITMRPEWTVPQFKGRWDSELNLLGWYMNDAEKALLFDTRKDAVFDAIMSRVMGKILRADDGYGVPND